MARLDISRDDEPRLPFERPTLVERRYKPSPYDALSHTPHGAWIREIEFAMTMQPLRPVVGGVNYLMSAAAPLFRPPFRRHWTVSHWHRTGGCDASVEAGSLLFTCKSRCRRKRRPESRSGNSSRTTLPKLRPDSLINIIRNSMIMLGHGYRLIVNVFLAK